MVETSRLPAPAVRASPWLRLGPVFIAATVYLVFASHPKLWNSIIWPSGMAVYGAPFLDMQGHLAASRAYADGTLVAGQPVPGDPMHRIHAGPTSMLWLGWLGLGPAQYLPFTALCLAAFLTALALSLRPTNLFESGYMLAVLVSPPVVLLVERGNIDLFVFAVLAAGLGLLAASTQLSRWTGWAVVAAFIGFKYYPAAAFSALLETRANLREKSTALLLAIATVVLFIVWNRAEIAYTSGHQVENRFSPFFGARELFVMAGVPYYYATWMASSAWAIGTLGMTLLLGPWHSYESAFDPAKISFAGGASITLFCFLATSSADYRLVFLIFCLPWLWLLRRSTPSGTPALKRIATLSLFLFLFVPWWGTLACRVSVAVNSTALWWAVLICKQLGWWLLMFCLGALLLRLVVARGLELWKHAAAA